MFAAREKGATAVACAQLDKNKKSRNNKGEAMQVAPSVSLLVVRYHDRYLVDR